MALLAKRTEMGLTQEELARRLGVPLRSYIRWEHGETRPSILARKRIKRIMGVEMRKEHDGRSVY